MIDVNILYIYICGNREPVNMATVGSVNCGWFIRWYLAVSALLSLRSIDRRSAVKLYFDVSCVQGVVLVLGLVSSGRRQTPFTHGIVKWGYLFFLYVGTEKNMVVYNSTFNQSGSVPFNSPLVNRSPFTSWDYRVYITKQISAKMQL